MDWIGLAQDRECGDEPSGSAKCWGVFDWLHNWRPLKQRSAPLVMESFNTP
jgi:hypothetical protein